jgi:hypothetical protein
MVRGRSAATGRNTCGYEKRSGSARKGKHGHGDETIGKTTATNPRIVYIVVSVDPSITASA